MNNIINIFNSNKKVLFLALLILVVSLLTALFLIMSSIKPTTILDPKDSPTGPTSVPVPETSHDSRIKFPKTINSAPTMPPERGLGLDTESEIIKNSANEIKKIRHDLPYLRDYRLSTGVDVSIVIPPLNTQSNYWTLPVQIFGINYASTPQDNDYELMRNSFREAAIGVFDWLSQNEVVVEKIIVRWGDKEFEQKSAREWLKN